MEVRESGIGSFGSLSQEYSYDVFGAPIGPNTPEFFGYTGKPYDPMTGLYDYGFRDYAPLSARFTTVDPIRDGANWYIYVGNNPLGFVDPLGLLPDTPGNGEAEEPDPYAHMEAGKVYAPAAGTAHVYNMESEDNPSGPNSIFGNMAVIDHGAGVMSVLGHLEDFSVTDGQVVNQGQEIGIMGNTTNNQGLIDGNMLSHLHWGVKMEVTSVVSQAYWVDSFFWDDKTQWQTKTELNISGNQSVGYFIDPQELIMDGSMIHPANTNVSSPYGPRPAPPGMKSTMHFGIDYGTREVSR